jgi:Transglycosylase SLT domain
LATKPSRITPSTLCIDAIRSAEQRYRLPPGLLFAISQVESGRPDPATGQMQPWPWTVQAEGQGLYFASKAEAVEWVQEARARGVASIDTGCMQVNLAQHPDAFGSLDDAFDPRRNADYAARFLLQLHSMTGEWPQAVGFYHSRTMSLATPYRTRVEQAMDIPALPPPKPKPTTLSKLSDAWQATIDAGKSTPDGSGSVGWSEDLAQSPQKEVASAFSRRRSPTHRH